MKIRLIIISDADPGASNCNDAVQGCQCNETQAGFHSSSVSGSLCFLCCEVLTVIDGVCQLSSFRRIMGQIDRSCSEHLMSVRKN